MAEIELRNVSKSFGDIKALDQIDLVIREGEFLVLLGPSGAGKTTTLKLIAGIEEPTSGEILFNGQDMSTIQPGRRDIAMVFESYALYPHLTVRKNMINPLLSGQCPLDRVEAAQRVERVAGMLRMEKYLDRMPRQLSGGQKQRVAMGRAMVREPEVFLLDEPLSHVDAKIREELRWELHQLRHNIKSTVVYVTHDYVEALSLGQRIAVINQGRLEQIGSPFDVYYRPDNVFVATHVGQPEINLFAAAARRRDNGYLLDLTEVGLQLALSSEAMAGVDQAEELLVGVRPQYLTIDQHESGAAGFWATVAICEDLQTELNLVLTSGAKEINVISSPDNAPREGEKVFVRFPADRLLFFVKRTGKRLSAAAAAAAGTAGT